jgi:hypothetical protein
MADFLVPGEDDGLLNAMVKVYEFISEAEHQRFIKELGWKKHQDKLMSIKMAVNQEHTTRWRGFYLAKFRRRKSL